MSAEDYTRACLDRIAQVESEVQAFVHLDPDHALAQARALDRLKGDGGRIGPLHGVPVGIKDIFDTADYPTECGSPALAGRRPDADAAAVRKLREAGAVIIGKTVSTEFAYFHPGKTRNPRDLTRTPGGSSSGSAASVAAGMVPLAIGSQTNGSMIRPAAFCGVFGIKPSHGLISRAGALTLSLKLDHVGAFARSVEDLALILDVLAGQDPADPNTRPYAAPSFRAAAAESPPLPPSFALVRTPMWDKADADTRSALEDLAKELGASEVDLPDDYRAAWPAQRAIMAADMAYNLGAIVDKGGEISKPLREFIAEGRGVTAVQYLAAVRDAKRYADGLLAIFERFSDAIITLSARGVAPQGIGATGDPVFCSLWTLTGLPSLNLPLLANAEGLPIGLQLVGAPGRDERLLRTARALIDKLADVE
jgi:Asp-tRNA(Asn)/Glu-tRNA(Gln) amidotransferase A subunit family amidase